MSKRYPGGVITKSPATPTGPFQTGAAPGIWTLDQQMQYQQQGIWPTAGLQPNYIEDVFSTWLYTGNGSTQTITNGIDLSTKGGLVWLKDRSSGQSHALSDTARGVGSSKQLQSNTTSAATTDTFTGFTTSGFTLDASFGAGAQNLSAVTYASWTFRKQPKFFDVVTYTGTGSNTTIAHNLGSVPGSIIVKRTDTTADWAVYHRSLANTEYLVLNTTAAKATGATWWNSTTPTSTVFSVGTDASVNASGGTYVAYLFAHDAGGFGLTGTDNVISCGSYTGTGTAGLAVTLGYEPQWILVKQATGTFAGVNNWQLLDVMRGMDLTANAMLNPNTSGAEGAFSPFVSPTATGFTLNTTGSSTNGSGSTYIYIAIRRGPMKVPTLGTSVFQPIARTGTGAVAQITGVGFPPDLAINADRTRTTSANTQVTDRLRGTNVSVFTNRTDGDLTYTNAITAFGSDGETLGTDATQGAVNVSGNTYINWLFGRAPGFFDEVCYTGTGANQNITHNLGVAPELMIIKSRSTATNWPVFVPLFGDPNSVVFVNLTNAQTSAFGGLSQPTSSVFSVRDYATIGSSGVTYVAYLFATCPGVSKVGSYTGNGTTQTINCGFTGGARFVLIKATSTTGNWLTFDTARGMTVLTDPFLSLNSTAAETATLGACTTVSTGFAVNESIFAGVNTSSVSFVFLAIA